MYQHGTTSDCRSWVTPETARMKARSLSSALTAVAIAPRAAEVRWLMQVLRSLADKIRRWLGLAKRPVRMPYGTGS